MGGRRGVACERDRWRGEEGGGIFAGTRVREGRMRREERRRLEGRQAAGRGRLSGGGKETE